MGTTHILYLYDDALALARDDPDDPEARDALALDLGRAILELTMTPDFMTETENQSPHRITWKRIGTHGNALHWCDEVHSSEVRLYVWAGNCLRELTNLEILGSRELRDVIERTLAIRASGR